VVVPVTDAWKLIVPPGVVDGADGVTVTAMPALGLEAEGDDRPVVPG